MAVRTVGMLFDMHVMSDLHAEPGERRDYDGVPRARRAVRRLNDLGVDWTVVGGDLRTLASRDPSRTDWGNWHGHADNEYYRDDYERAIDVLDGLDAPYYPIRGNHDRPVSVWEEFFPPEAYPRWFFLEDGGARYVFLDSNPHEGYHHLTQTQNFVSAPQLSMLERLMDDDPEVPTFVFCHAPLAAHTDLHPEWASGRTGAYRITLNYPSVQRVLERGTTVLVNTGHYSQDHGREAKAVEGVEYVLARHFGGSDPDYAGDLRWMTVDTDEREATVHYRDMMREEEGVITTATW